MAITNLWPALLGYYSLAIISAVLPWMNAELLMLSALPVATSPEMLGLLVLVVSAGQMTGKSAMYWVSRMSTLSGWARWQYAIDKWRALFTKHPRSALGIAFLSALVGFPPFYVVSIAAGALRVAFGPFLALGFAGRLIHFGLIAFVPNLLWRTL